MKPKNGVSTVEKINNYIENKQFKPNDDLFWDAKQQEESDDEAPEEMSFQGFTKKSSYKFSKMSSKAKKALREEKDEQNEKNIKKDADNNSIIESDEDLYDTKNEESFDNEKFDSDEEGNTNEVKEILKPKVPFNFKASLLSRKRKDEDLLLNTKKQNMYIRSKKVKM
uniref:NUC153 domain-containing protein n=1 Tax=Parastrongyloides trichosuri TaxID=131310 RepID=A0A0N4ZYB0_PARTI